MRLEFWVVDLFSQERGLLLDKLVVLTSFDFLVTMVSIFWTCSPMSCKITTIWCLVTNLKWGLNGHLILVVCVALDFFMKAMNCFLCAPLAPTGK